MQSQIKEEGGFKYLDEGEGEILLLLHGLFGALSNWQEVVNHFKKRYRVIIPMLPVYEMPVKSASVEGLVDFVEQFTDTFQLRQFNLLGNSLGGHIALVYCLRRPEKVKRLVLTGSSGLFENTMGGSFPKRGNYEYIRERVAYTFYNPENANKALVNEVFEITNDIKKCMCIVAIAKAAQRHNMARDITAIETPTLLIWGLNDTITPPLVAHDFNRLIKNSVLRFIDKCGHAPMMERPEKFNIILEKFLNR